MLQCNVLSLGPGIHVDAPWQAPPTQTMLQTLPPWWKWSDPNPKVQYVEAPLLIRIGSDLSRPFGVSVGLGSEECEGQVDTLRSFSCSSDHSLAVFVMWWVEMSHWGGHCYWELPLSWNSPMGCKVGPPRNGLVPACPTDARWDWGLGKSGASLTLAGEHCPHCWGSTTIGEFFWSMRRYTWSANVGWVVHVRWHTHEYQDPMF